MCELYNKLEVLYNSYFTNQYNFTISLS